MKTSIFSPVLIAAAVTAQHNTSTANGCNDGFYPGTDTVIFTTPYTYTQVLSIIGDYQRGAALPSILSLSMEPTTP
jgi:hypothetical protein